MPYAKLIIRGLLRHKKKGIRLFVLLGLSVGAIIFSLSFRRSFYSGYVDLGIDSRFAHLQVVSPESVWFQPGFGLESEELPLIRIDMDFENFVRDLPGVEIASPAIETTGVFYTLDGELLDAYDLTGIRPDDLFRILPATRVVQGDSGFAYDRGMEDIPILRWNIQEWEIVENNDRFVRADFRPEGEAFEVFKQRLHSDFPCLFEEPEGEDDFLAALNQALQDPQLYTLVPDHFFDSYDYRIDDSIFNVKTLSLDRQGELPKLNKRLLESLYPEVITPVPENIHLNMRMTLNVAPAKEIEKLSRPKVLPVKIVGFVEAMPLYFSYNYIDLAVLQEYLELSPEDCSAYLVRLEDRRYTDEVRGRIESYLRQRGLDYRVIDYRLTGKHHLPTATAFNVVLSILIVLFIFTIAIFVINTIMLAIIKRRREIGTSITLGMSKEENILVFLGEVLVIVTLSSIIGSILGSTLVLVFSKIGLPGIIFFPEGLLHLNFYPSHLLLTYLLVLGVSLLAAGIPLLSLRRFKPVELLRE